MTVRTKVYGLLGAVLAIGLGITLWKKPAWVTGLIPTANAGTPKQDAPKDPTKEATPVELAVVKTGDISSFISATANLHAVRDITVATQAEGIVQEVLVEEGDAVKQGQLLCRLDDSELKIALDLAQEKLAQAKVQLDRASILEEKAKVQLANAQAEVTRAEGAFKAGVLSGKEAASYRYKQEELQHDQKVANSETKELTHHVAELEADIAEKKLEIERTRVLAPFEGQITGRMVTAGQRVRALDTLFNLGAFSPLQADVHLSEKDTREVRPRQRAIIHLGADESAAVQGTVERISPVVDQSSGTVKVTVTLNAAPGFRPGSFVRVEIQAASKSGVLLVPKKAVLDEDGQSYVYVASGNAATRKKVELGYTSEGVVEVRSGLAAGDKVVVAGQGALKEGSKIKIVQS